VTGLGSGGRPPLADQPDQLSRHVCDGFFVVKNHYLEYYDGL